MSDVERNSDLEPNSDSGQGEQGLDHSSEGLPVNLRVRNDRVWMRRLLPLVVLGLGVAVTLVIVSRRKPPKKERPPATGTLVEVVQVSKESRRVSVRGHGKVQPKRMVSLAPEVAGRVTWVNPSFVVGGLVRKGAPLVRISGVDYKLAVEQSRAQIAQAERALAEASSNAQVSTREWGILGKRTGRKSPNPLTLGRPQLKQAQAMLASAKAALQLAKVRLSRTVIRAPFNLRVRAETVEVGQFAVMGQPFGQVFGTDEAEVLVPLKLSELGWIDVPRQRFDAKGKAVTTTSGSQAWISLKVGGKTHRRRGRLMRTVGEIDPTGSLTRVVVSLDDPYNLKQESSAGQVDFEIGSFVEVTIEGRQIADIVPIPVQALRLGNKVWVASPLGTLEVRKVVVARMGATEALIRTGLGQGDRVITSPIGEAMQGMKLRPMVKGARAPGSGGKGTPPSPKKPLKQAKAGERGQ